MTKARAGEVNFAVAGIKGASTRTRLRVQMGSFMCTCFSTRVGQTEDLALAEIISYDTFEGEAMQSLCARRLSLIEIPKTTWGTAWSNGRPRERSPRRTRLRSYREAGPSVEVVRGRDDAIHKEDGVVTTAPTFQEAIAKLQSYWSSVGCTVWLPHNTEVRLVGWNFTVRLCEYF